MVETSARHSVSVAAIIANDLGQVLIQRRDNGQWEPPGGVLELGESIHDGLKREVREETGLDIEPGRLTGVYKNMPRGIIALVFRAHAVRGAVDLADETVAHEWVAPSDVEGRCDEAYAVRVLDALTDQPPAIRAHDGVRLLASGAASP
jgi:8-oxo-dGTP pyrophosphatase MutT (NUDIX family)